MGGFYLITAEVPPQRRIALARTLDQSMRAQCLGAAERIEFAGHTLQMFRKRAAPGGGECWQDPADGQRFAAACGTLIVRGLTGTAARRSIVMDGLPDPLSPMLLGGFCLIRADAGRLELRTDPLGLLQVYRDRARTVWSSSFLAVASAVSARKLDTQSVYEYVFTEQPHGCATLVEEVELHDSRQVVAWNGGVRTVRQVDGVPAELEATSAAGRVEFARESLRSIFGAMAAAFGDQMSIGLSGGFDSRLVLAAMLSVGLRPRLHVYGTPASKDVRIAAEVASTCGLPLHHTDKASAALPDRESYLQSLTSWLHAFDGYPADGLMGNGQDLATRLERAADGALVVNGGGGEIFRNFFGLSDREYTCREILWTHYSQFDPATTTHRFDENEYYERLESKLADSLGHCNSHLTRGEVEWLYVVFRCRFWMGRNNSVNSRFGHYMTPLVAFPLTQIGLAVPLREKNHGRFELDLIRALNGDLARRRILRDRLALLRSPRLRRHSFRVRTRIANAALPPWRSHAEGALGRAQCMASYFRLERVRDPGQLNRIYTLELLATVLNLA